MYAHTYPSLEAFYAADSRRRYSRERDVGLLWRDRGQAAFRAAWVQETGEVYLFLYGEGTVDVLERRFTLRALVRTFAGYRDVCGKPGSLLWFVNRADVPRALVEAA